MPNVAFRAAAATAALVLLASAAVAATPDKHKPHAKHAAAGHHAASKHPAPKHAAARPPAAKHATTASAPADVVDAGKFFSPAARKSAEHTIATIRAQTSPAKSVVVRTALKMPSHGTAEAAAERIFRNERLDGVLLYMVKAPHRLVVMVGHHTGERFTGKVRVRDAIVARFKANDYDGGLRAGLDLLAQELPRAFPKAPPTTVASQPTSAAPTGATLGVAAATGAANRTTATVAAAGSATDGGAGAATTHWLRWITLALLTVGAAFFASIVARSARFRAGAHTLAGRGRTWIHERMRQEDPPVVDHGRGGNTGPKVDVAGDGFPHRIPDIGPERR